MLQALAAGAIAAGLALSPLNLQTHLTGPGHVYGTAEYDYEAAQPQQVDVELHNLMPGQRMTVFLHGVLIGTVVADRYGEVDREIHTTTNCRAGQQIRIWHNHRLVANGTFRVAQD